MVDGDMRKGAEETAVEEAQGGALAWVDETKPNQTERNDILYSV